MNVDKAGLHIGTIAFIHRFGFSLNAHVHFHVCVVDGVFGEVAGVVDAEDPATSVGVTFQPATGVDADAVAQVQATLRRCIQRAFVGRGLIDCLAVLLPSPRIHLHRYFGVLEPNSTLSSG